MISTLLRRPTISDFIEYVKCPEVLQEESVFSKKNLLNIAELAAMLLAVQFFVILPVIYLWKQTFSIGDPLIKENSGILMYLLACLVLPIIEEFVFRGWMNGKPRNLWLAFCGVGFLVTTYIIAKYILDNPLESYQYEDTLPWYNRISWLFAAVAGWFLVRDKIAGITYRVYFPRIFYFVAAAFAFIHVFNYAKPIFSTLPMVIPQFWSGVVFGYARQKYGLMASIIIHASTNTILLIMTVIF